MSDGMILTENNNVNVLEEDLGVTDAILDTFISSQQPTSTKGNKTVGRVAAVTVAATIAIGGISKMADSAKSVIENNNNTTTLKVEEKPKEKVLAETISSAEITFGVKGEDFKTSSGNKVFGTLNKEQSNAVKRSAVRPTIINEGTVVHTAEVKDGKFKESVTYQGEQEVYSPDKGEIFEISGDKITLKHQKGNLIYYSILKGVALKDSFKEGQKLEQATHLGSSQSLDFSIAMKYDKKEKEFYEFIHPNEFVDIDKSDNFRYQAQEFEEKSQPVIKAKIITETPYEKMSAKEKKKVDKQTEELQKELEAELKTIPKNVLNSRVVKGLVIETPEQMASLKSKSAFYRDWIPVQYLENGKAIVDPQVEALRPILMEELKKKGLERFCDFLLAKIQQETGGNKKILATDPMQSSQSKNEIPDSITDPRESIVQGIIHFENVMKQNDMFNPLARGDVRQAIHSYNMGGRVSQIAKNEGIPYSLSFLKDQSISLAKEYFARMKLERYRPDHDWRGKAAYGDVTYVAKIFNCYEPAEDWEKRSEEAIQNAQQEEDKKEAEELAAKKEALKKAEDVSTKPVVDTKETSKENSNVAKSNKAIPAAPANGVQSKEVPWDTTIFTPTNKPNATIPLEYRKVMFLATEKQFQEKINSISKDYAKPKFPLATDTSLEGEVYVLNAGHGGKDSGAISLDKNNTKEKDSVLGFVLALKEELEKRKATVHLVRATDNEFIEVDNLGQEIGKYKGATAAISFHHNSQSDGEEYWNKAMASGVETYYENGDASSLKLANSIHPNIAKAMYTIPDRGVKTASLAVFGKINNTNSIPTILLETGFLSHAYDTALLNSENVRKDIINGIVMGLMEFSNKKPSESSTPKEAPKDESKTKSEEAPKDEPKTKSEEAPKDEPKTKSEEAPKDESKTKSEEASKDESKTKSEEAPKDESKTKSEETPKDESKGSEETVTKEIGKFVSEIFKNKQNNSGTESPKDSKPDVKSENKPEEDKTEKEASKESKPVSVETSNNDNLIMVDFVNKSRLNS